MAVVAGTVASTAEVAPAGEIVLAIAAFDVNSIGDDDPRDQQSLGRRKAHTLHRRNVNEDGSQGIGHSLFQGTCPGG